MNENNNKKLHILIRVPNWLGDLVMSYAFFEILHRKYPHIKIDVIVKKNLSQIIRLFPQINKVFEFDKQQDNNLLKISRFAQKIDKPYDYFFCLPNSFSSAWMGFFTKAKNKIGYKNEMRSFLLNQSYAKPKNIHRDIHRVENYIQLLEKTFNFKAEKLTTFFPKQEYAIPEKLAVNQHQKLIALNLVSVDKRRTFDIPESIKIIEAIQAASPEAQIAILGTEAAKNHIQPILQKLGNTTNILDLTAKTNLLELTAVLANANLLISTDSGPAHLANSLATPVIVFFGAGNPNETSPYEKENLAILDFNKIDKKALIVQIGIFL